MNQQLTFNNYQQQAAKTAIYEKILKKMKIPPYLYLALGLAGETGEVLEKIKKLLRDKNGKITNEFRETIIKELGDILWYISELSRAFGIRLNEVAVRNIEKLRDRASRHVIKGSGDDR